MSDVKTIQVPTTLHNRIKRLSVNEAKLLGVSRLTLVAYLERVVSKEEAHL